MAAPTNLGTMPRFSGPERQQHNVTPTDHDVDPVDGDDRTGLNRRQMIKAAGIAGAAAWTAPMIIDSLSSPAAAVTVAPGCYRMWQGFTSSGGAWGSWLASAPNGCLPTGCTTNSTAASAAVTLSGNQPVNNTSTAVTVTVNGGFSCRITSASAFVATSSGAEASSCETAINSVTGTHVNFAFGATFKSVAITPRGVTGTGNDGFWDNEGGIGAIRSSIGIVLTCP
jgi:hypothetical protein